MIRGFSLLLAATAATAIPMLPPAAAEAQAPRQADRVRIGPYLLTVYEGAPPDAVNARNSRSRGIRIFEKPHSSTFAAVAAQEIFETDYKRRGGRSKLEMELISHEIEALVASRWGGHDFAEFEAKEAYTLTLYRRFRGIPEHELLARMRAMRPVAERWLSNNRDLIQKLVAYRFPR